MADGTKVTRPWREETKEGGGVPWYQYLNPLYFIPQGVEQLSSMMGAAASYYPRLIQGQAEPLDWWQYLPFTQAATFWPGGKQYQAYQEWKGSPQESQVPLGIPSWSQWGEWLGISPEEPGYQMAHMGAGDIYEVAPWLLAGGGGAAGALPRAGETLFPRKTIFGLGSTPPQAITKRQATRLLAEQVARGETPAPELLERVGVRTTKPIAEAGLIKPIGSAGWEAMSVPERVAWVKNLGLGGKVGSKSWQALTMEERAALLRGGTIKPIVTAEGKGAVEKLTDLIKAAKPARGETAALRREELARRVAKGAAILEKGEGREAFLKAQSALKGALPKAEFIPPELQFTKTELRQLYNLIRDSGMRFFEKIRTRVGLDKLLMEGKIPQSRELELLEDVFGKDLVKAILSKQPFTKRAWWTAMDIAGIPRAVLASWDLSAPLRQGLILGVRHPKEWIQSWKPMLRAFASEKYSLEIDANMRSRPFFNLFEDSGGYVAPLARKAGTQLTTREEMFMTRFTNRIPLIRHSERAFVVYLNELRTRVWETLVPAWEKLGATTNDYKELATFINWATGRGTLGPLQSMGPLLNATLFSPRLVFSRLQLPAKLFSSSPMVRKEAWQTLMAFLGFGATILSSVKLLGGEVELDPRSSDFAKVKIGNTRLDIWAGYVQYIRFAAQLATAERKTVGPGNIQELNRLEVANRFMQSKYSPAMGLLNDILQGQTYMGEEMALDTESLLRQTYQRLAPLFIQDMIDAIQTDGLMGGFAAFPAIAGVGSVSYRRGMPYTPWFPSGETGGTGRYERPWRQ